MTSRILAIAVSCLFLAFGDSQAQEMYTLKNKAPIKGEIYHVVLEENDKTSSKVIDGQGQVVFDLSVSNGKSYAYVVTVLDNAAGQIVPTASVRNYEKALLTEGDKGSRVTNPSFLQGKKVLIEKKGDDYQFRLEDGKELTALELGELDNNPATVLPYELLTPKNAVKLNENWSIDPVLIVKTAPKEIAKALDASKATAQGKLIKAYKKDNKQFGVIELHVEFPFKDGADLNGAKLNSGKVVLKGIVDGCIDGSSQDRTFKKTMEIEFQATQEANGMRHSLSARMTGSSEMSITETKKK